MTLTPLGQEGLKIYVHTGEQLDVCSRFRTTDMTGKPVNWTDMITRKLKGMKMKVEAQLDDEGKPKVFGEV
jgi:hypothetical protein